MTIVIFAFDILKAIGTATAVSMAFYLFMDNHTEMIAIATPGLQVYLVSPITNWYSLFSVMLNEILHSFNSVMVSKKLRTSITLNLGSITALLFTLVG